MVIHILETEVLKVKFLNFYIWETRLYILLKLVLFMLKKW